MGKPVNIASTSHAQQAEMAALLGGGRNYEVQVVVPAELQAKIDELTAELAAERIANREQILAAATSAPTGE